MDVRTRLGRLSLKNPILVASGTFGYAREAAGFVPLERLGAIIPKTVTVQPRVGNAPPRIVETASGMLNSIGLDNDGIDHFLSHHLPYLRSLGTAIIVNVAGKDESEFAELALRLADVEGIDAIELNLSCPNVSGGIDIATDPAATQRVVAHVRGVCRRPILVKLTPNVRDIVPIAKAARAGGADGVTLINTLLGTAIDWRRRRPILGNAFGGLSGPAIKPIALRFVLQVARAVDIPIVAAGGIATIDDVMEFLVAGASAVQIGTANFYDPSVSIRLLDALPEALRAARVDSVGELVGTVEFS